jgi:hypothetical protein
MAGQALFFLCDESLLSGAKEKTKVGASEASDRLLLAVIPNSGSRSREAGE